MAIVQRSLGITGSQAHMCSADKTSWQTVLATGGIQQCRICGYGKLTSPSTDSVKNKNEGGGVVSREEESCKWMYSKLRYCTKTAGKIQNTLEEKKPQLQSNSTIEN